METNLNNGGLLPSAMALKDSLNLKPDTSSGLIMLTPYQQELLRRLEVEIDDLLAKSPILDSLLARIKSHQDVAAG